MTAEPDVTEAAKTNWLRDRIRAVLATSDEHDPRAIAAKVQANLDGDELAMALEATLPAYVRTTMSAGRLANREAAANPQSSRWKEAGGLYRSFLNQREYVGTEWKKLGELTRDEVLEAAAAVHGHDCRRCGPSGKPALAGSPLTLGHQEARALRKVAKEILKDLWKEARRIDLDQVQADTQPPVVAVDADRAAA